MESMVLILPKAKIPVVIYLIIKKILKSNKLFKKENFQELSNRLKYAKNQQMRAFAFVLTFRRSQDTRMSATQKTQ